LLELELLELDEELKRSIKSIENTGDDGVGGIVGLSTKSEGGIVLMDTVLSDAPYVGSSVGDSAITPGVGI